VSAIDSNDLLLARITAHGPRDPFDVPLQGWAEIGLPKPSTARLVKLVSIDARLVHHSIGILSQTDRKTDRKTLAESVERLGVDIAGNLR